MKASITTSKNSPKSGFSLFEMLTFVAILGIIIAMAVPLFGNSKDVHQAAAKRNAQNFCTLANSASAAGYDVTAGITTVEAAFKRLSEGVTIPRGPLKGRVFRLPNVGEQDIKAASEFAKIQNSELIYLPSEPTVQTL
jgi:type II secretory pathway pseudopilin PulG